VCTVHFRKATFVYFSVQRGTVSVLNSIERQCVCTVQYREALCVYCTV